MARTLLLLLALALMGCEKGYDGVSEEVYSQIREASGQARELSKDNPDTYRQFFARTDGYLRSVATVDSLLQLPPSIRWRSDSLARKDSLTYAYLLSLQVATLYFDEDTTAAVFAYLDAAPWFHVWSEKAQTEQARLLAETTGDALSVTHSPNMARLTYQAFERAKRLAIDHGDAEYIHLADSSYTAVARRVLTMPDSVRAAFGPPPDRPARVPWVLATLAAAFIAVSLSRVKAGQGQNVFGKATALG